MHMIYLLHIFFYQISPTCFGVLYIILRENLVYLLKTVIFLQGCYVRCVIKYNIYVPDTNWPLLNLPRHRNSTKTG